MHSAISFIVVLGILIFVHEFGHFLFAKLFRVKVLKFSLGFGPKLLGFQPGETEYLLSAFPLGGYVKMVGENPTEEVAAKDRDRSFALKPVWQRFLIVFAGPLFNLLFAVVLFFGIFALVGMPDSEIQGTTIGAVSDDSPAAEAGLQVGDTILSINGVQTRQWQEVSRLIRESDGEPVTLLIDRQGEEMTIVGRPEFSENKNIFGEVIEKKYLLGISPKEVVTYRPVNLVRALTAGFEQTWSFIYLIFYSIIKMIQKVIPASELGGPILIAQMAGKQMESGLINFCYFMGLVSVNLGVLNLFPIPILDGGHLVFFSVEALRKRPLSRKTQEMLQQVGLVILASLMIFVFYNDIVRLFSS